MFLRAFGGSLDLDGLLVVFGLANVVAAIPITPGGLGIVETTYITTLVGFGMPRRVATLGVASYRLAQYWLPILLGGLAYLSLRVGPWSISRRDRLERLRDIARREDRGERAAHRLRHAPVGAHPQGRRDRDAGDAGAHRGDGRAGGGQR